MAGRLVAACFVLVVPLDAPAQLRVDDHGFPLPAGAVARLGDLHFAQPAAITASALSPDGKTIASAGSGIFLWDAATGLIVRKIAAPEWITILTFSRDGKLLAAASQDGEISVWNLAAGKWQWQGKGRKNEWGGLKGLRFVANDRILVAARTEQRAQVAPPRSGCQVQLWDAATGDLKQTWKMDVLKKQQNAGENAAFVDVALSPSGEQVAWLAPPASAEAKHCTILIHETLTGRLLREVKEVRAPAEKIDLLDEGQKLLVKSTYYSFGPEKRDARGVLVRDSEGSHAVVDVNDRRAGFRFDYRLAYYVSRPGGEQRYVTALGAAPDGKSVYLQDEVGMVRRNLATGEILEEWRDHCQSLAFFPDGKRVLLVRGSRLLVCDEKLRPMRLETEFCHAPLVQFQADGRLVASHKFGGRLNVWDVQKRRVVESMVRLDAPQVGRSPCSHDSWRKLFAYQLENGVVVQDLLTSRRLSRLEGVTTAEDEWNVCPVLSGDGKRVLVSSREKAGTLVRWFDTRSGRELGRRSIAEKEMFPERIRPVNWFSADGSIFGFVAADGRLALVDCASKERPLYVGIPERLLAKDVERTLNWPVWEYESAGFDRFVLASRRLKSSPNSREYLVCERANKGRILSHFVLQPSKDPNVHWHGQLSPDGRVMAVKLTPDEVKFHETATGRCCGSVLAAGNIESFDFSPDGKTLATSCADTSILLWDIR